jgi:hypothetical protein
MVRNLTTSGDPNVGPFAPRSLTRFFAREHRPPYRPNCHIVSPVDGVGPTFRSDSELRVLCVSVVNPIPLCPPLPLRTPPPRPRASFQFCNVRARDSSVRLDHSAQSNQPK